MGANVVLSCLFPIRSFNSSADTRDKGDEISTNQVNNSNNVLIESERSSGLVIIDEEKPLLPSGMKFCVTDTTLKTMFSEYEYLPFC